jgi:hypothetical protein
MSVACQESFGQKKKEKKKEENKISRWPVFPSKIT